jgi:hypothetical protein
MRHRPRVPSSAGAGSAGRAILALWIGCFALVQSAAAEVRVSGTAAALTIQTRQATLQDVLQALHDSFKLQYSGGTELHRPVDGTYSGPLQAVLADLLDGHNYALHYSAGGLELTFFGAKGSAPVYRAAPAPPPPPPPVAAAQTAQAATDPVKECRYNGVPVEC